MISERERLLNYMDKHSTTQLFTHAWFDYMRRLYHDLKCINGLDVEKEFDECLKMEFELYHTGPVTKEELDMVVEWIKL